MPSLRAPAVSLLLLLLAAGCGGGDAESRGPRPPSPFAYERTAPIDLRDHGVVGESDAVRIRDISYASPRGGRVRGYLVVPRARGRHPAVIYLHGAGGDRRQMLVAAARMAIRGAVTLTIDSARVRDGGAAGRGLAALRRERDLAVQSVTDVRRAVDVLASLPSVDRRRIALVGWSAGARTGAVVAGVERRIRAFVFVGGGATPVREYVAAAPARLRPAARRILHDIDPLRYVARAAPAHLLFQNGRRDEVVPRSALVALAEAASEPKRIEWYDGGHAPSERAHREQAAWLAEQLGLR